MTTLFDRLVVGTLPFVPKAIVGRFAKRYVAGATLEEAVRVIKEHAAEGAMATLDVLGESVTRKEETLATRDEYLRALEAIAREKLVANVSIKPTAVGLAIDPALARQNFDAICKRATELGIFIRLDMEDTPFTESTLQLALDLKKDYPETGVVVQAYLRRSLPDLDRLVAAKMNIRICKGIYIEPREHAYKDRQTVIQNFGAIVEKHLAAGCYAGIATHDEACVQLALATIDRLRLTPDRYEFQMLHGVDPTLRKILIRSGHRLRVYVPYGRDWYPYSIRRLKENPAIARHALNALVRGG